MVVMQLVIQVHGRLQSPTCKSRLPRETAESVPRFLFWRWRRRRVVCDTRLWSYRAGINMFSRCPRSEERKRKQLVGLRQFVLVPERTEGSVTGHDEPWAPQDEWMSHDVIIDRAGQTGRAEGRTKEGNDEFILLVTTDMSSRPVILL